MKLLCYILKSSRLGNGLRHVAVFSKELGRVDLLTRLERGAFPLALEPFSTTEVEVLQKPDKFEIKRYKLLKTNFPQKKDRLIYLSKLSKLLIPYQLAPNTRLFELLQYYSQIEEKFQLAYTMFALKFAFLEGIFPTLNRCIKCGSSNLTAFSVKHGGVVCQNCREKSDYPWSIELSKTAIKLAKNPFKSEKSKEYGNLYQLINPIEDHIRYRLG